MELSLSWWWRQIVLFVYVVYVFKVCGYKSSSFSSWLQEYSLDLFTICYSYLQTLPQPVRCIKLLKLFWKKQMLFWKDQVAVKSALSGLIQFLVTESPLKMMKNASCFTLKALFSVKIFKFQSWHFGNVKEQPE